MKCTAIAVTVLNFFALSATVILAQSDSPKTVSCGAEPCPYLNPSLTPEERAKDLVGRMTLEEKVSQMQDVAPAIPRLGVPAYNWWNEALHGVARNGFATNFPQSIGLAATWDTALMHRSARRRSRWRAAPSTTRRFAMTITADSQGSRSGRRISTSFAIRAGAEEWRHSARIRS